VNELTLDERFEELRRSVDCEIVRARCELIGRIEAAVVQLQSVTTDAGLNATRAEWNAAFAGDPAALKLLTALADLLAPMVRKSPGIGGDVRAQRFARVKIAEIQLYQAPAVKAGRAARDLYGSLQPYIDAAREQFKDRFLTPGQEIGDYLHAELVRELANDDASLLGPGYPGPLA
jgi:hypothetical protein